MENCIATRTTPSKISGQGKTILLVEDEAFVREITCQVLESAEYRVLQASNAEEALWTFCQHEGPVHLLLTDMVMPGKTGPALAAELGALAPEMKTILTSGYGDNVVLDDLCRDPRIFYLSKPYSVQSLTCKVRSVLDENESCRRKAAAIATSVSGSLQNLLRNMPQGNHSLQNTHFRATPRHPIDCTGGLVLIHRQGLLHDKSPPSLAPHRLPSVMMTPTAAASVSWIVE